MSSYQNNKILTDKEIKEIELKILEYISDVCNKEKIQFFLTYGSLLGAARHSGFIPWDDDIDVMIRRCDEYRLIEAIKKYPSDRFKFISLQTNKKYHFPLAKVYDTKTVVYEDYGSIQSIPFGVNIDVFVLDNLPDDKEVEDDFFSKGNKLRYYYGLACRKFEIDKKQIIKSIIRNIVITPFRIVGYRFFAEKYDRFCQKYNTEITKNVGIIQFGEGSGNKERIPIKCLTGETKLEFEGGRYLVPNNYNEYLTQLYGDYMTLPPKEKRVTKHKFIACWK